ncbi:opioid-binding protein/cell adhesion molecule isoform X1 [Cynoglossus semilaevis]|uniref:Opioid-binding protein/cell adhesion molecule homolog n=2 Tax=Cynoglossus semilaevis TaxID=244447 RepID=A0A3P8WJX9_CYNSE|nr:coiled-coil domain-containing protein 157-like isoform X1 [Cynoglossus semilaevis]
MVALLGQYDFVDEDWALNQDSHTVLLELVIDRLLLLLQGFSLYIHHMCQSQRREQSQKKGSLSLGFVVKNYWRNLVHFVSLKVIQKDNEEWTHTMTQDCEAMAMSPKSDSSSHSLSACSSTSAFSSLPQSQVPSSLSHSSQSSPKVYTCSAGCQTVESSSPCKVCRQVQSILKKTGNSLVEIFLREGLPSSIRPVLAAMKDTLELGRMTEMDVTQWTKEQLRDMRRLGEHLQNVRDTVEPLKGKVSAAEAEKEKLKNQVERAQKELKEHTERSLRNEKTINKLELRLKETQLSIEAADQRLRENQQHYKKELFSLEDHNATLKETFSAQQNTLKALECEKIAFEEKVKVGNEACCQLQQKVEQVESQLSKTQMLLDKECAKYRSTCQQQESVVTKQTFLLERVDALDKECEELQRQLEEREERHVTLQTKLQQMSTEKELLLVELTQQRDGSLELQKENQKLESSIIELNESKAELKAYAEVLMERERLLVAFPQLSLQPQAQPESTGDVILDMELQMQANCLRMLVLQQENANLHSTLEKLRDRMHSTCPMEPSPGQKSFQQTEQTLAPQFVTTHLTPHVLWTNGKNLEDTQQKERSLNLTRSKGCVSPTDALFAQMDRQTLNLNMADSVLSKIHTNAFNPNAASNRGWKQSGK